MRRDSVRRPYINTHASCEPLLSSPFRRERRRLLCRSRSRVGCHGGQVDVLGTRRLHRFRCAVLVFTLHAGARERNESRIGIFDAQSGSFVGGCGLNQFNVDNGFCNLGYWVRQSWHRRGAASAAIQALSRVAFSELQLGRVEIVVAVDNIPSLALAAKSGALRECLARNRLKVHGKFTDAYVFSLVPEPEAQSLGEIGRPMPT